MKVTLIDYTGSGWQHPDERAAAIMIFTKSTRLNMSPGLLDDIMAWPYEKKLEELNYMANTIPSSWEFVDYTFMIEGVTRAFTHQLVRTRQASYAQQTMRILDVSKGPGWDFLTGPSIADKPDLKGNYTSTMSYIARAYQFLIRDGANIEDARGILPTNILTNIVMKINMRNFVGLVQSRSSPRVQGEYRDVLKAMQTEATRVHSWLPIFVERTFDKAAADLDFEISTIDNPEKKVRMMKLVDQLRAKQ